PMRRSVRSRLHQRRYLVTAQQDLGCKLAFHNALWVVVCFIVMRFGIVVVISRFVAAFSWFGLARLAQFHVCLANACAGCDLLGVVSQSHVQGSSVLMNVRTMLFEPS